MKAFIVFATVLAVSSAAYTPYKAAPSYSRPQASAYHGGGGAGADIPIVRQASDINADGSYSYSYETGNGISASETGYGGQSAQGSFQFTAPDGSPVQIQYIADENGFQPTGSHIPTPPPIPEAIARALAYIEAHPYHEDAQQAYRKPAQPSYQKPAYNSNPFQSNKYRG